MSQQIPLAPVASQRLAIVLAAQNCLINVYQKADLMYCDLTVNDVPVLRTHAVRNRIRLLLAAGYFGFQGDLVFVDTQGDEQPSFEGLGSRWFMLYLPASEIAT
jgi:hypothetical protein